MREPQLTGPLTGQLWRTVWSQVGGSSQTPRLLTLPRKQASGRGEGGPQQTTAGAARPLPYDGAGAAPATGTLTRQLRFWAQPVEDARESPPHF